MIFSIRQIIVGYLRKYSSQCIFLFFFVGGVHFIEMFLCRRQDYSVQEYNLDNRAAVRCESERIVYKVGYVKV